jgi:hypothetical protein
LQKQNKENHQPKKRNKMNLIPTNNTGLAQYNQGLGFLGIKLGKWLKKGMMYVGGIIESAIRTYVPFFGDDLGKGFIKVVQKWANAVEQYVDNTGLNGQADGEVTPYEALILDEWLQYQFAPFVEKLVKDIALAMGLPSNTAKIVALNAVLNKINAVNDHYAVNDNAELSQNAIEQKQYLIFTSFQPIVEAVKLSVESLNIDVSIVPVSFSLTSYDYTPLFTSSIVTTVKGDNFKINSGTIKFLPSPGGTFESIDFTKWNTKKPPVIDLTKNTGVVPPVTTPTTTVPVVTKPPIKVPVTNPTVPEVIPPVTPPVTSPITPGNNTGSSTKEETTNFSPKTEKKTNTVYYWLGAALIAGAILVKSKEKDSKGKKADPKPKTTTGRKPAKK